MAQKLRSKIQQCTLHNSVNFVMMIAAHATAYDVNPKP